MLWGVLGSSKRVWSVAELWMIGDKMEWSFVRRQSTESFSLVFGYGCVLLYVPEIILFAISFPIAIVKSDCQLIHGLERVGFALFLVCYQILKAIWQPLAEIMA